jgi:exonuclease VII small subunit
MSTDPSCREIVELVTEYLEGALPLEQADLFQQHLLLCAGCHAYLDQMRRTIALTRALREDDVAPEVMDQLLAAVRSGRR